MALILDSPVLRMTFLITTNFIYQVKRMRRIGERDWRSYLTTIPMMNGRVPERISNIEKINSAIENVKGNSQSRHQNEMDTQSKAWEKCTDSAIRLGT